MRRLALFVLPLLLLAACGDDGASAQEVVAAAPEATAEATTAKTSMRMVMSGIAGAGEVEIDMEGVIDFEHAASEMTLDMGDLLGELGVEGDIELRSVGSVVYMRSAFFSRAFPGVEPDTWLKIDAEKAAEAQGLDLSQLQQFGNNDPRQGLAVLSGVTEGGVEEIGEEEVRGTATTRYRARIDLEKAAKEAGAYTDPEAFRRYIDALGTDSLRVEVWIDEDDQIRRMRLPLPLPEESGGGEATMTVEYYDFGADVDVSEPAADEVVDFLELMAQLQQRQGG